MTTKPNYNNWHIEVTPKTAGDFGGISISSIEYDKKEAESLQQEIEVNILRHIDRVSHTRVVYESYICSGCDTDYETEKEADDCCLTAEEMPQLKGTKE